MYINITEFFDDQIIITHLLQLIVMIHGIFSGRDNALWIFRFLDYLTFIKQHNMYNFYGTNTLYFYTSACVVSVLPCLVYVFRFVCWILWMITSRTDIFHFSSNQATPLRKIMDVIQVTITISPREDISATTASITMGTIITMASINTNTITMEKTNMAMTTIAIITTIMASSKTSLYLQKFFLKKLCVNCQKCQ